MHDHAEKQTGFLGEVQDVSWLQMYLFLSLQMYLFLSLRRGLVSSTQTVEKGT